MKINGFTYELSPGDLFISGKTIYFQITLDIDMTFYDKEFYIRQHVHNLLMRTVHTVVLFDNDK
jgi:hypothetical protein